MHNRHTLQRARGAYCSSRRARAQPHVEACTGPAPEQGQLTISPDGGAKTQSTPCQRAPHWRTTTCRPWVKSARHGLLAVASSGEKGRAPGSRTRSCDSCRTLATPCPVSNESHARHAAMPARLVALRPAQLARLRRAACGRSCIHDSAAASLPSALVPTRPLLLLPPRPTRPLLLLPPALLTRCLLAPYPAASCILAP